MYRSHGTKSIVEAVQSLYPRAKVQRFDTDNTKSESFSEHYEAVSRGDVDILIGTQMLTKGLDLPKLGFVGVISADTSLSFPDYTAGEKTYQILSQVLGRIARGHRAGSAVIQTYQPTSPAILAAVNKDWSGFYESELAERQKFGFPPFWHLLKLTCTRKTSKGAQKAANDLAENLSNIAEIKVIGPSPSFYEKRDGSYSWQIIVKAKRRPELLKVIAHLPSNWKHDIDPTNLL